MPVETKAGEKKHDSELTGYMSPHLCGPWMPLLSFSSGSIEMQSTRPKQKKKLNKIIKITQPCTAHKWT